MINRRLTGADRARDNGYDSLRAMLLALMKQRGFTWNGQVSQKKVRARIDFGRWLADCECGAAGYVDPADPNCFFCLNCGTAAVNGAMRMVAFPVNREALERELLKRPVAEPAHLPPVDTAINSKSMVPGLSRSWRPGETAADLAAQLKAALKAAEA